MSDYSSKMCPILSVTAAKTSSSIIGVGGVSASSGEADVTCCIGPSCMFFVPFPDEQGRPSGRCAIALIPTAIAQLSRGNNG